MGQTLCTQSCWHHRPIQSRRTSAHCLWLPGGGCSSAGRGVPAQLGARTEAEPVPPGTGDRAVLLPALVWLPSAVQVCVGTEKEMIDWPLNFTAKQRWGRRPLCGLWGFPCLGDCCYISLWFSFLRQGHRVVWCGVLLKWMLCLPHSCWLESEFCCCCLCLTSNQHLNSYI